MSGLQFFMAHAAIPAANGPPADRDHRADWRLISGAVVSVLVHFVIAVLVIGSARGAQDRAQAVPVAHAEQPTVSQQRIRLGEAESDAITLAWLSAENLPEAAVVEASEVDQAALDPLAGASEVSPQTAPAQIGGIAPAGGGGGGAAPTTQQEMPAVAVVVPPTAADILEDDQPEQRFEEMVAVGPQIETGEAETEDEDTPQEPSPQQPAPPDAEQPADDTRESPSPAIVAIQPGQSPTQGEGEASPQDGPMVGQGEGDAIVATGAGGEAQGVGEGASENAQNESGARTLANPSDREAMLAAIREAPTVRWGSPTAAKGLRIRTVKPRHTHYARIRGGRGDIVLRLYFGPKGTVQDHALLQSSGHPDIDRDTITTAYRWTATGEELGLLGEEQSLPIELRIIR